MKHHLTAAALALLCAALAFDSIAAEPRANPAADQAHIRAHSEAELASMRLEPR